MRVLVILLYLGTSLSAIAQKLDEGIKLETLNGQSVIVGDYLSTDVVTVILFLSPECPLCQDYTLTMRQLHDDFEDVSFIGVVPGNDFSKKSINSYIKKYKISFPVLIDRDYTLVKNLGASITPEAFLIGSNWNVEYSGAINNWAAELLKKRQVITQHYLKDAIISLLANEEVQIKETKAIGCFIEP